MREAIYNVVEFFLYVAFIAMGAAVVVVPIAVIWWLL